MIYITFFIIFLILVIVSLVQRHKNNQVLDEILSQFHSDNLTVFLVKNPDIVNKYPVFYKVVASFEGVNFNDALLKKSIKKVDIDTSKELKKEMISIADSGTENEKLLLGWYVFTCKQVSSMIVQPSFSLSGSSRLDNNSDLTKEPNFNTSEISLLDDVCLV